MKALILSDIHSNINSLQAIWEKEQDSDIIYCTGDLVDSGPFPNEVIDWVREHNVICTMGNHDERVIQHVDMNVPLTDLPERKRNWAYHNANQLTAQHIAYLRNLPETVQFQIDDIPYVMKHQFGDKYETIESIHQFNSFWNQYANLNHQAAATGQTSSADGDATPYEPQSTEKRIIFGHTHWQGVHYLQNDALWLNPGSTSYRPTRQKEDRSLDAQYMTITDGFIEIKNVVYDVTPLIEAAKKVNLPSYWG